MSLTRRQFIQSMGIFSAMTIAAGSSTATVLANVGIARADYRTKFLQAMETPFAAPLNDHFEGVIASNNNLGLILYDVQNERLLTALAAEKPLPVASAFKSPLLMYFVDQISPEVWGSVPVQYWNAASADDLPEAQRQAWRTHRVILRALYQTLVLSDNVTTGQVLAYVAREKGRSDALVLFNEWSRDVVGTSQLSGLSAWESYQEAGISFVDERYVGNGTSISSRLVQMDNMMTARDLGLYYIWMLTNFDEAQQEVCRELLSTIHNNRGANLERLAQAHEGIPYSKNGSLATEAGYVVADAGLIALPDERLFLLVMLSIDPDDAVPTVVPTLFDELSLTFAGRYNEILHHHRVAAVSPEELLATYRAHLQAAYTLQTDASAGQFRYGFILPEGVRVYRHPDEQAELHNPIIKSTKFGIRLLMQGALVRFVDVDQEWIELMPDDHRDNVRARLGVQVFVKREDIWPISMQYAAPIASISSPDGTAADKFVVIDVVQRQLAAFEGGTPLFRIPIVLNPDATPRGAQVITSKWFARSMQPWAPGVPFTAFFGAEGFALHGSPWQRWSTTVNQETIRGRTSAGCVNVPDWMVTAGAYTRPADELLFRWVGGMEHPDTHVFDYPSDQFPALRIFSVDYLPNLREYYRPDALVNHGLSWDDIIAAMETTPLQAPDSFFL